MKAKENLLKSLLSSKHGSKLMNTVRKKARTEKEFVGLRDMAQFIKCWSHKHECLNSLPKHPCEKLGVVSTCF